MALYKFNLFEKWRADIWMNRIPVPGAVQKGEFIVVDVPDGTSPMDVIPGFPFTLDIEAGSASPDAPVTMPAPTPVVPLPDDVKAQISELEMELATLENEGVGAPTVAPAPAPTIDPSSSTTTTTP